ncbi:Alpha/Beta hydrolase protein [Chaetomium sp. MPI-CAGE-AT-0009]|nr:Alpha/Beta hydrolase protein [Chaetomium sp. MPI-CAGE-AT-0009]
MLFKPAFVILALSQLAFAAPAAVVEERQQACQDVHIFLARGTSEPYPGRQSKIVSAVCQGIRSCGYEDIVYPASFNPSYCASVSAGISVGTSQLTAYARRCPNSKLVLTGYSQGAHLVGDILGGGGGSSFAGCTQSTNTGLNPATSPGNKIVAALLFGDVRHAANQPYNTGTGVSGNGLWRREGAQLQSLNRFSNVLRSWCLAGDNVCAGGSDPQAHTSYFDVFSPEAGAWVKTKL